MSELIKNNIPNGWIETTLGRLVKVGRGSSPRPIHNYLSTEGIPWVKIADATASDNKYIEKTKQFIIEEGRSTSVKPGNLIVSNSATPGIPKIMAINACVHDGWLVFDDYNNIDKLFLYYFFLFFRKKLNHSASRSVFKNLKTDIVRNIELIIPTTIEEQKAIAKILTAFDDKIELLQAQNKILETTAQTVFREWFWKYQIGEKLPGGWRVGKLGEIVNIKQGKYVKSDKILDIKDEAYKFPLYGGGGLRGYLSKFYYETPQVVLTCRGNGCGKIQLSETYSTVTNSCMALEDENSILDYRYIYLLTQRIDFGSVTSGSAQPQITVANLEGFEIVIPTENSLSKFNEFIKPIFLKLSINLIQIQTLKQTRDTLLPKLMSGQLRVNLSACNAQADEFKGSGPS